MKAENDKIVLESRREIEILQNTLEIACASGNCNDEEKEVAKTLSAMLDTMWYSW